MKYNREHGNVDDQCIILMIYCDQMMCVAKGIY